MLPILFLKSKQDPVILCSLGKILCCKTSGIRRSNSRNNCSFNSAWYSRAFCCISTVLRTAIPISKLISVMETTTLNTTMVIYVVVGYRSVFSSSLFAIMITLRSDMEP